MGNLVTTEHNAPHTINVQSSGNGWFFRNATAKLRRLISCKDLEYVFINNGVQKIQIRALGGRNVLISFPDVESRDSTIKQEWLEILLEEINPWKGEQASEERFVWLACFGKPLNARSYPTFEHIGSIWGQFLKVEENTLKESSFEKAKFL